MRVRRRPVVLTGAVLVLAPLLAACSSGGSLPSAASQAGIKSSVRNYPTATFDGTVTGALSGPVTYSGAGGCSVTTLTGAQAHVEIRIGLTLPGSTPGTLALAVFDPADVLPGIPHRTAVLVAGTRSWGTADSGGHLTANLTSGSLSGSIKAHMVETATVKTKTVKTKGSGTPVDLTGTYSCA